MKAVLLAAGKGTRLKPLTDNIPKVMIPINGKPILEYHIEQLAETEVREVFINLHHLPKKIKAYFQDGRKWGLNIQYSYESEILGTAGAVKKLENKLGKEPFLGVYGDNFLDINYKDFVGCAQSNNGIGTVVVFNKEDVPGCGILDIGENNRVIRFKEKPAEDEIFSNWVSAGVFYFRKKIFKYIDPGFSDFGFDVLPRILDRKERLFAYKLNSEVLAVDRLELLTKLRKQKSNVRKFR